MFDNESSVDLKSVALRASKWALMANIIPRLVTPALQIVLARLLIPEDYGIVAIATLLLTLLTFLQPLGLEPALIQWHGKVDLAASVAFWISLSSGIILYGTLWVVSPYFSEFYSLPSLVAVFRILGLNIVISSFAVVPSALLQRRFQNRSLFWSQSIASVIPFLISIPMALNGMGYWALLGGMLIGSMARTLLVWYQCKWYPARVFHIETARNLLRFGRFVVLESFLAWLLIYLDNAVVGKVLGTYALGIYSIAFTVATMIISVPLSGITGVTMATFSRLQKDKAVLMTTYLKITRLVAMYAIPASIGLALVADPFSRVMFGSKWDGLGPVLAILALYSGFGSLWILSSDAFRAMGRPDVMPKFYIAAVCYMIPIFLLSAPYGLVTFSLCRASVVAVFALPHTWLASKYLGFPKIFFLGIVWRPLVASAVMACVCLSIMSALKGWSDLTILIAIILVGSTTYTAVLRVIDKNSTDLLIRNLRLVWRPV